MRRTIASLLLAIALILPGAARGAIIVALDAASAPGTVLTLDAGTWRIDLTGVDAWNSAGGLVSVCDPAGAQCKKGWTTHFGVDLGYGVGQFDRTEGIYLGMAAPGYAADLFASPAQALAAGQAGPVYAAPLDQLYSYAAWEALPGPILLTLPEAQPVNFFMADEDHGDNLGGLTLRLTPLNLTPPSQTPGSPVPEPDSWVLMLTGLGAIGGMMRRSRPIPRASPGSARR